MNGKLIALVLTTLPVAAMADVTLYGTMAGGIESDAQTGLTSQTRVDDYISKIGFKGSENLDNGLMTIWQVENRVHLDGTGGGEGLGSRQTFVGLDGGNLGQIRLGYLNSTLNDQYAVDQWSYGNGVNGLIFWSDYSGIRLKNAIRYDSASFYGFSGAVMEGFGENALPGLSASNVNSWALDYSFSNELGAHYAGQHEANPEFTFGSNDNHAAIKQLLEVDYSANNLFLSGAYQWATGYDWQDGLAGQETALGATGGVNTVANGLKIREAALSAGYTFGAFTPKVSIARGWNASANGSSINDSGYSQYVLGVDYALSRRTTAGVTYGHMSAGQNTSMNSTGVNGDVSLRTVSLQLEHNF